MKNLLRPKICGFIVTGVVFSSYALPSHAQPLTEANTTSMVEIGDNYYHRLDTQEAWNTAPSQDILNFPFEFQMPVPHNRWQTPFFENQVWWFPSPGWENPGWNGNRQAFCFFGYCTPAEEAPSEEAIPSVSQATFLLPETIITEVETSPPDSTTPTPANCIEEMTCSIPDEQWAQLAFHGQEVYSVGDFLTLEVSEEVQEMAPMTSSEQQVDLWIAIQDNIGQWWFMSDFIFEPFIQTTPPYFEGAKPFRRALDGSVVKHIVLKFQLNQGMEGEYFFYAFYMTEGQAISQLATKLRSNIAIANIRIVTE